MIDQRLEEIRCKPLHLTTMKDTAYLLRLLDSQAQRIEAAEAVCDYVLLITSEQVLRGTTMAARLAAWQQAKAEDEKERQ